jgi:hypothetical protein
LGEEESVRVEKKTLVFYFYLPSFNSTRIWWVGPHPCHSFCFYFKLLFSFQTDTPNNKLPARHFRYTPDCGKNGVYINFREVSGRFELDPGQYVIIPSTFKPDCSASFMLRVFGEKTFSLTGYELFLVSLSLYWLRLHILKESTCAVKSVLMVICL